MNERALPAACDVVVIGSGNAGLCAALSAAERGASVVVLEKAPADWVGGNSYFTAGAFRIALEDEEETRRVLSSSGRPPELRERTVIPSYPREAYDSDLQRLTQGQSCPELSKILIEESTDTAIWLGGAGVPWTLMYERQAHEVDGHWRFWGGLFIGVEGQGPVLVGKLLAACVARGVEIHTDAPCLSVDVDPVAERLEKVTARDPRAGTSVEIACRAVVIASGGYEANPRLRASYLGPGWDSAHVRGTPYNTGELLHRCVERWAAPRGQWSGAHAVAWDASTPRDGGDRVVSNNATKQGYWLGIVVNREGKRFLDEGADFRNYTYAKYGREILAQPGARAYQVFDAVTRPLVNESEYGSPSIVETTARTLEELAERVGLPVAAFVETVRTYNDSIDQRAPLNPVVRDGRGTSGISPPKSNWAQPLTSPPFYAYEVTCGVTFTFGGFATTEHGAVLNQAGRVVEGVYAAGETVGGLFYDNYPGGTGLMSGAVFGRRAGAMAAGSAMIQG